MLPEIRTPHKTLIRQASEVIQHSIPSINQNSYTLTPDQPPSAKKLKLRPDILQGFVKYIQTPKHSHPYFHRGLCLHHKGVNVKANRKYFEHMQKSQQILKEIKQDRCLSEPDSKVQTGFHRNKKLVLALDLDETLIHCCNFDPIEQQQCQYLISYRSDKGVPIAVKINIRPFVLEFLIDVSKYYDIVIYTASEKEYANAVVNILDPNRKFISEIFHREHCFRTKRGYVVKDLRVILPQELDKIVLVDNSSQCFAPQINNGIPIISYTNDDQDQELLHLRDFLLHLKDESFVTKYLENLFRLSQYTKFADHERLQSFLTAFHSIQ